MIFLSLIIVIKVVKFLCHNVKLNHLKVKNVTDNLSLIFTARKRSLQRLCFYRCLSVHREGVCVARGCAWQGACVTGGPAWWEACMAEGMHGGGMHGSGVCIAGWCAWQVAGHAWWEGVCGRYYEIRSMSRRYASYWNAFL